MVQFPAGAVMGFFLPPCLDWLRGPTQSPIQWIPGTPFPGVKCLAYEADHRPSSNAEVKNACGYTNTPPILLGVVLN
jgi:hypothetical protein